MSSSSWSHQHERWIDHPGYPLTHDYPKDEYDLRIWRARQEMTRANLDALVITSSGVGSWFTSAREPHEWHDRCAARSTWYILTHTEDYLYMTPTACGEHFTTTRRSTWVSHIGTIVERSTWPRQEIWDIDQMPGILAETGLARSRLGFELGDCMTLGITVQDLRRLEELMPLAQIVDGSSAIRRLMSIHTPLEIERVRRACEAGVWAHNQVPRLLESGLSERAVVGLLARAFSQRFGPDYSYQPEGAWDVRNPKGDDSSFFHHELTDRRYRNGDLICRATSGVSYKGYGGDLDRVWYLGEPPAVVRDWYGVTWECNQAMASAIQPGATCAEVYAAGAAIEERQSFPERGVGRTGHGLRNTGGLSVHPGNQTVLEPGMILSVEAMFGDVHGFYDLEDQYLVTSTGHERLHERAPEQLPCITA